MKIVESSQFKIYLKYVELRVKVVEVNIEFVPRPRRKYDKSWKAKK